MSIEFGETTIVLDSSADVNLKQQVGTQWGLPGIVAGIALLVLIIWAKNCEGQFVS